MDRVTYIPPFSIAKHESGWWVVKDSTGREIDDSGDGGFFEQHALVIANALNAEPLDLSLPEKSKDIFIVHLPTEKQRPFSSLARAIQYLVTTQPLTYKLEAMEGDQLRTLVSPEESFMVAKEQTDNIYRPDFGRKR